MYGKSISIIEFVVVAGAVWVIMMVARYIACKWDIAHDCYDDKIVDSPIAKQLKSMKKAYNEKK